MKEADLNRERARQLSNGKLADEIQRCRLGMQVGANQAARDRFERRLHIMQEEADRRMRTGGAL